MVVEVLSISTAKRDRGYKKNLYEKCGVKEYWLVDTDSRSIEVHLLKDNKFELDEVYAIYPDYITEKMTEEELGRIKHEFTTSLFADMVVKVEDVFAGVL